MHQFRAISPYGPVGLPGSAQAVATDAQRTAGQLPLFANGGGDFYVPDSSVLRDWDSLSLEAEGVVELWLVPLAREDRRRCERAVSSSFMADMAVCIASQRLFWASSSCPRTWSGSFMYASLAQYVVTTA
ncbi:hypothetical protein [Actinopolymorpha cephalotaxi]|uniref:Uncharacterized protein n=1 Tax=Actinopolymorpha cephalotaxi TaxID=504797 RepID=A0ABX2SDX9_9ACTN|nr:hypothetical protein [Actinopolymorpha cephalotaxi]NYH86762.1 hypothetical protein [Actinopolymorpha cephalotaxi]